jgi:regulator of sigma E protease
MFLFKAITFLTQNLAFAFAGLVGIVFLIGFHELGHFLFCKLFNIRTPTFSIGFGPRLFQKKIGDTEFVLSAIPLGGFVEITGMAEMGQGEQKEAHSRDSHSFAVKPHYQKFLVMFGGILFNLMFAYFAFILLGLIGMPKMIPTISSIQPDSAAERAHLMPGDTIIAIDRQSVDNDLQKTLSIINGLPNKETTTLPVTIGSRMEGDKAVGLLGITGFSTTKTEGLSLFEAIKTGISKTNELIMGTLKGFANMFAKRDTTGLQGPLSIISLIMQGIKQSFGYFLFLLALISVNLAILNLIPLPILDGGQILYYTIEAIIGRQIPLKIREYIHIASWLFVLGLILYLSAHDIYRMIKPFFTK